MLPEGIYEQMIVYIFLSFWIAGSCWGCKAWNGSVKLFCFAHCLSLFPLQTQRRQRGSPWWFTCCQRVRRFQKRNQSRLLKHCCCFIVLLRVQTVFFQFSFPVQPFYFLFCFGPVFLEITTTQRTIFIQLYFLEPSFSYLKLHRLDLNAMIFGRNTEINNFHLKMPKNIS